MARAVQARQLFYDNADRSPGVVNPIHEAVLELFGIYS